MANNLGKRWEERDGAFKRSYMTECHLCDEYLYLPVPIKNNARTFRHIIYIENDGRKYRVGQPKGGFGFVFCQKYLRTYHKLRGKIYLNCLYSYYEEFAYYTKDMVDAKGNIYNVHRPNHLCPVELRQWQKKFGPNRWDAF